jgi:hypothetical protein
MSANLLSFLSKVPDPRRKKGSRHPLPSLLAMIVIGNLSGYYGYRELARFMMRHAWEFVRLFGFEHGVPGHVTIREVLGKIDFEAFTEQFQAWLSQLPVEQLPVEQLPVEQLQRQGQTQRQGHTQQAYSLDGKSLKSTLSDYPESYQDLVAMVQVFSHQSGQVVGMQAFHNGKQGEAQVVRDLIQKLDLKGAMLTLDALHSQKKR